jgi:anti-anti-sigma regulatory factor
LRFTSPLLGIACPQQPVLLYALLFLPMKPNRPISSSPAALPAQGSTVNLDEVATVQLAQALPRNTPLHIDCSHLTTQRTLGVGHVVSQLLLLHRAGMRIWLRNVNAPLRRCLQLLRLNPLFHFSDPA